MEPRAIPLNENLFSQVSGNKTVNSGMCLMNAFMPKSNRGFLILSFFVVISAVLLRLYHIEDRSLWLDEAKSANFARGTFAETLSNTQLHDSAPIAHPFLLYVAQKIGEGPFAVRVPSLMASVLAVLVMLGLVYAKIEWRAAVFSALMLAVSASQIAYAQEVRSYALSVLFGALLLWAFLYNVANSNGRKGLILLCAMLFLGPLIQYGLVLFGFGVLSAMGILYVMEHPAKIRISHVMLGGLCLGAGGLCSLLITLRHQLRLIAMQVGEESRRAHYFDFSVDNPIWFIIRNTYDLVTFVFPGVYILGLIGMAVIVYAYRMVRYPKWDPPFVLAFTSLGVAVSASLGGVYPYSGTRQCLYLAPVLTLAAALSLSDLVGRLRGFDRPAATIAVLAIITLSGFSDIKNANPYQEVEDVKTVLEHLGQSMSPEDEVYVYHGARPAIDFYQKQPDQRFIYGEPHRDDPKGYITDLLDRVKPEADRLWLVFSHVVRKEDQFIIAGLKAGWDVETVISVPGAALYVANRRIP